MKGQEKAKRALEIAAAGRHHLLMVGPPGSGKSMLAARLPGILPPLEPEEALETSMIHSLAGLLDEGGISRARPFRTPHHTASMAAIVGGGRGGKAGRDQPGASRRAVPRRAAGVPAHRARDAAPADRDRRRGGGAGERARALSLPLHAGGGGQSLPLRASGRSRAVLRAGAGLRGGVSRADLRAADGPVRPAHRGAAGHRRGPRACRGPARPAPRSALGWRGRGRCSARASPGTRTWR